VGEPRPWGGNLDSYINAQVCQNFDGEDRPIVSFNNFEDPIRFMLSFYSNHEITIKSLYNIVKESDILTDSAISGFTNCSNNCQSMKQARMAVTLFLIKFYSWDTPFMITNGGKTAQQIYDKFYGVIRGEGDRFKSSLKDPAYKIFIEIFIKAVKIFEADTTVT
jgi:hypothetical protein